MKMRYGGPTLLLLLLLYSALSYSLPTRVSEGIKILYRQSYRYCYFSLPTLPHSLQNAEGSPSVAAQNRILILILAVQLNGKAGKMAKTIRRLILASTCEVTLDTRLVFVSARLGGKRRPMYAAEAHEYGDITGRQ